MCCRILWFALLLTCAVAAQAAAPDCIDDGRLRLTIEPQTGGVRELLSLPDGERLLAADRPPALWQIRFRDGEKLVDYAADQAGPPQVERLDDGQPGLRLVWEAAAGTPRPPIGVRVEVRLGQQQRALAAWRIAVLKPRDLRLTEVRFPRVGALRSGAEEALAVPIGLGQIMLNPRQFNYFEGKAGRSGRLLWQYPHQMSLQCLAYYQPDGPGFYAACDDSEARAKTFTLWGDADKRLHFEIIHHPEAEAQGAPQFAPPYAVITGALRGDWSTAAEIYRQSPPAQSFAARSRLGRGLVPAWVQQTGLWVWNRGRSEQVLTPAVRMGEHLHAPVSVFWHWWHDCAYDAGFPEYLPPREGTASFTAALKAAQRAGLHVTPYINQRLWGMQTASWTAEGAERFAVKDPAGAIKPEVYNVFLKAPCAAMCLGTAFWRAKYAGLAQAVICDLQADGIYMDQACMTAQCHDPDHGHVLGAGRYWVDGFGLLALDIRDRTARRGDVCLAGEHCGEAWLPYLDAMLTLQVSEERTSGTQRPWSVIPFFPAVYHASGICYGSYGSLVSPPYDERWPADKRPPDRLTLLDRKFSTQFLLEQARSFVWGLQPMLPNFLPDQLETRREELDFVTRLVRVRMAALKYLLHGTWLRPPALNGPQREIDFGQVSVYAPFKTSTKSRPLVHVGVWRARDGDVGIALANIGDAPVALRLPLDLAAYGLGQARLTRIDERGSHPIGDVQGPRPELPLELPARAVWLIECRGSR